MTTYTLNPCVACNKYLRSRGQCNLHQLNNCLVETSAAFTGIPSTDSFRKNNIEETWQGCIDNLTRELGRTPCELRMAMAPVFVQAPHYFPNALVQVGDKDNAYEICMEQCSELSNNKEQCKINCQIDYDTVVSINKGKDNMKDEKTESSVTRNKANNTKVGNTETNNTEKSTRKLVVIIGILVAISFVGCIFLMRKNRK